MEVIEEELADNESLEGNYSSDPDTYEVGQEGEVISSRGIKTVGSRLPGP